MSKRDDILAATMGLITAEGLSAVTLSRILDRAKVGSGTLYNYFLGKDDLVKVLFQEACARMNIQILREFDPCCDVRLRFDLILTNLMEYSIANMDELNFIQQYIYMMHKSCSVDLSTLEPDVNPLLIVFRNGQEQKIIKPLEEAILLQIVTGIIVQIANGYHNGKFQLSKRTKENVVNACWDAIRA